MSPFEAACEIVRVLRENGFEALLAGGCVRDMLLKRTPVDYDVATSARPQEVLKLFRRTLPVGIQFGVVLVLDYDRKVEVATFRTDDVYEDGRHPRTVTFTDARGDAERRDFTVNAMFYDVEHKRVIDYVGGRKDLKAKIIRAVGDPLERFEEDKLRMLRAVRFAATLSFKLDHATADAVRRKAKAITVVSAERIAGELERILVHPTRSRALRLMDELGLLEPIFPEVAAMKGVKQSPVYHPEGDVLEHTLNTMDKLEDATWPLALATLLHDVGKPVVRGVAPGKFYGHDVRGAKMAEAVCRRLKLSNKVTERVKWLVKRHLYLWQAPQMKLSTLKRVFAEPGYEELVRLHRADALASDAELDGLEYAEAVRAGLKDEEIMPAPLISGKDLIELGLEPGPLFGKLLGQVVEEQLQGNITERDQALDFVRRRIDEMSSED